MYSKIPVILLLFISDGLLGKNIIYQTFSFHYKLFYIISKFVTTGRGANKLLRFYFYVHLKLWPSTGLFK